MNRAAITAARYAVSSIGLAALAVSVGASLVPSHERPVVAHLERSAAVVREIQREPRDTTPVQPQPLYVACMGYERPVMFETATVGIAFPQASRGLDRVIIKRYVKRQSAKLASCYEHVGRTGTVRVDFVITANGTVSQSTARGINTAVASCVAEVVKAINFPKPTNEGNVKVSYPLKFQPPVQQ